MTRRLLWIAAIALFAAIVYFGSKPAPQPASTSAAKPDASLAPDFTLQDIENHPVSLAGQKGKVVLLDFWATWCTPCQAEIPRFVEWQQKYRDQGLVVLGVAMDDSAKPVPAFAKEYKINYPVLLGTDKMADSYGGVLGLPINFVIGRDGRIAQKFVGATDLNALEQTIQQQLAKQP